MSVMKVGVANDEYVARGVVDDAGCKGVWLMM